MHVCDWLICAGLTICVGLSGVGFQRVGVVVRVYSCMLALS